MRIVVPGLLAASVASDDRLPALERILAYGVVEKISAQPDRLHWQSELLRALKLADEGQFPSAPLTLAGSREEPVTGRWWHLDPARMDTSIDGVAIRSVDGWSSEHVEVLAPTFRKHLAECGLGFEVAGGSMFARNDLGLDVETVSPQHAAGKSLRDVLPSGKDGATARRLITELQMLVHDRLGDASINAVWLWGEGKLAKPPTRNLPILYGNEKFAKGIYLIHEQRSRCNQVPESFSAMPSLDDEAIVLPTCNSLRALEVQWFEPLVNALHTGAIGRVELYLDGASVRAERSLWKRVFAKSRAVREVVS